MRAMNNLTAYDALCDYYHFPAQNVHWQWVTAYDAAHYHGANGLHPYFHSIRYLLALYILDGVRDEQMLAAVQLLKGKHRHRVRNSRDEFRRAEQILLTESPMLTLRAYEALTVCYR